MVRSKSMSSATIRSIDLISFKFQVSESKRPALRCRYNCLHCSSSLALQLRKFPTGFEDIFYSNLTDLLSQVMVRHAYRAEDLMNITLVPLQQISKLIGVLGNKHTTTSRAEYAQSQV
ncbi:hypothetical protein ARMGADRAFT_194476 [Armillaria gallica]|uniref:Uncharacterized protein n=1 Tax=Armillaria gallica TaxID=47427 RepID=A0A2H3D9Q2_ARMGA|nr:hypothetical protein ARMGADRAFT_194476 [Armillaria gallica]